MFTDIIEFSKPTPTTTSAHISVSLSAKGQFLPNASFVSEWTTISPGISEHKLVFDHGLNEVPLLVYVEVKLYNRHLFQAMGMLLQEFIYGSGYIKCAVIKKGTLLKD